MEKSFELVLTGFTNPTDFVEKWSSVYSYGSEEKYRNHIQTVLESEESFFELFRWKNGTGDEISDSKTEVVYEFWEKRDVLLQLREKFDWSVYEEEFYPSTTPNIWKLFLLHLVNPDRFPIYDQHVFRFYHFHRFGEIREIPQNHKKRYLGYRDDYFVWFNQMREKYNLNPKKMDESFFSFGKFLKRMGDGFYSTHTIGGENETI